MLGFFRKYQKYLYIVVTVVIVISFSFFGTYGTLIQNYVPEKIAFTAVDGTPVKRSDLEEMALFIGTDANDKVMLGGLWGPNFLNDGTVQKDFLETGLAEILATPYLDELDQDLSTRLEKEKRFIPYSHPQAKFLGVETAWAYLAPEIKKNYDGLLSHKGASTPEAFAARVNLYLAEKKLPAPMLRHLLRHQQKQYNWLLPDPELERVDLSLFNYHTTEDWFGPRFVRVAAQFIINCAILAEEQGYSVSKGEVIADLIANAKRSYQENRANPYLGVRNASEYFEQQLRQMNMDQNIAIKTWKQVMLFRRYFHDAGNAIIVDPLLLKGFQNFAKTTIEGKRYRLPEAMRFSDYKTMQKFEIYLDSVAKRSLAEKGSLQVPSVFLTPKIVEKKNPELVQKRYLLEVSRANKNLLQAKVGIRETWNWEAEEQNWELLKKSFPELSQKTALTQEEKFHILDSLDDKTRARVDSFARSTIIDSNQEWLEKALSDADAIQMTIGISTKGGREPLEGVKDRKAFLSLLDKAPIEIQSPSLSLYSGDSVHYYRIRVLDRSPEPEILTFAEANAAGILDPILDKELEAYYKKVREGSPDKFQKPDKGWKPLADVRDQVADLYFAKLLKNIKNHYSSTMPTDKAPEKLIGDRSGSLRLFSYAQTARNGLIKNPVENAQYIQTKLSEEDGTKLPPTMPLSDQWKFEEEMYSIDRSSEGSSNFLEPLSMEKGEWSPVVTPSSGDIQFIYIQDKRIVADEAGFSEKVQQLHLALSNDAQRALMVKTIEKIREKGGISLDYLKRTEVSTSEVSE